MKFLKPFTLFEREMSKAWIDNNKDFYLIQNKELSNTIKNKTEDTDSILLEIKSILKGVKVEDLDVKMTADDISQLNWRVSIKETDELTKLVNLYKKSTDKRRFDTHIDFQVEKDLNRTHTFGLSKELHGIGLGYKMYKALISEIDYARSSIYSTNGNSRKIWYHLIQDSDFYSIILNKGIKDTNSNQPTFEMEGVMIISKSYPVDKIKELIKTCKETFKTIELDDELKNIVTE